MATRRYKPEEIVSMLRCQAEAGICIGTNVGAGAVGSLGTPRRLSVERAVHSALSVLPKPDRLQW